MHPAKTAGLALIAASAAFTVPAHAEVVDAGETGFVVRQTAETDAAKDAAWRMLIAPALWWSGEHTRSGDAANLYIDAQATGCFCEKLPRPADAPDGQRMGSVEHMHVVYADPQAGLLRMTGLLGPLQAGAGSGTLTITLVPAGGGTRIAWEYVVGGYLRADPGALAGAVDAVLGEQIGRLADKLGRRAATETLPAQPGESAPAMPASSGN